MSRNKSIVEMQRERDQRLHTEAKLKTNELTPVEAICDCSQCQAKRRRRMRIEEAEKE